jgi:hypothetical protein
MFVGERTNWGHKKSHLEVLEVHCAALLHVQQPEHPVRLGLGKLRDALTVECAVEERLDLRGGCC